MTHTEILEYIIKELQKHNIQWKNQRELFEILVPNLLWEEYKKSWYHWINKTVKNLNKSQNILQIISKTLGFDNNVWDMKNEANQKLIIKEAIEKFAKRKNRIDLSDLLPQDDPITEQQKEILKKFENLSLSQTKNYIKKYENYFSKKPENQSFLLQIISLFFYKGYYDLLEKKIFKLLLPHNLEDPNIKIIKAHTLGNLSKPKYLEAAKLLNAIANKSCYEIDKILDLKTSVISNLRRNYFHSITNKKELKELLENFISYYEKVFYEQEHYYPAINLAYLLKIKSILFNDKISQSRIKELYKNSTESIAQDKNSENTILKYYAFITEYEFTLLKDQNNNLKNLEIFLEEEQPKNYLTQRTKRQIEFFINMIKKYNNSFNLTPFLETIKLLEDYQQVSK